MTNRVRSDFLLALCSLSACLGVLYLALERNSPPVEPPLLRNVAQAQDTPADSHRELEKKVEELTRDLDRTSEQLNNAMARLTENAEEARQATALTEAMARIPAPQMVVLEADGQPVPHFRELLSPSGQTLATDVQFHGIYGRRLVFRGVDNHPTAFDVEEVHPGVLGHLEIDLNAAKQAGLRAAEKRRARAEAAARRREERAQAEAAALARERQAVEAAEASIAPPTTQTTHITINQPPPAQAVYTTPVFYYWNHPVRRTPVRRNYALGSTSGFQFNIGPVSASVAPTRNWVGSDAARFPYNQGFRFNQTGPYTTIPR